MENGFIYAGKQSVDFGLYVEHYPPQNGPERKRTTVTVPGRNGDLHYDEGAYENYTQSYECGFYGKPTPEQAHEIKAWLLASGAYQRLEDVHDAEYFRLASFAGPLDIENKLNKIGKCTIAFDCKPQSFLKSGENKVTFASAGALTNPTNFPALPMVYIYGTGAGSVTIGDVTVSVLSLDNSPLILDCEGMSAYSIDSSGTASNKNSTISAAEFPCLESGDNAISWTGNITSVEIVPRWWTL